VIRYEPELLCLGFLARLAFGLEVRA
jgi:hypothetical protein